MNMDFTQFTQISDYLVFFLFVSLTSKLLIPPEHTRVDDDDGLFVNNSYQKRLL